MRALLCRLVVLACLAAAAGAQAQQQQPANGLLLIAKPSLADPNFARTVVLVTQTEDASTVGVILNRPSTLRLQQFLSGEFPTQNYREPLYLGGPVMRQAIVALYRAEAAPAAPAFHVLKRIYLSMHPDNIKQLLETSGARYRLYAGFSGWAPNQLQSEFMRDGWHVFPAEEEILFRKDHERLWEELIERVRLRGPRASR